MDHPPPLVLRDAVPAGAVIALGALISAAVPQLLYVVTDLLGVQVPVNLAFFVGSLVLFLMTLQHSSELGRLEERTRTLAEEIAVLRLELGTADRDERRASGPTDDGPQG